MRYQAEIKQFLDRQSGLEENLMKAYALIFGTYCSKAIQSRVEEHPDFETTIRDDPIELLKTINILMHDTVRAKYPYASLHDVMMRLFNLRQQEHEHLTDYVKRFKQTKDVVKAHMGSKWLEQFVEHTEEYQKETDTKQQSELKNQSFERYMAFVLLRNSDQAKYRSLMNGLISQYSMENDQYPKSITAAIDILANHKHDNYSLKKDEKYKKQDEEDNKVQQVRQALHNLVELHVIAVERRDTRVHNVQRRIPDQGINGQSEELSNIFKQKLMVMMIEVLHQMQQVEQIEVSKTKVGVVYKSI